MFSGKYQTRVIIGLLFLLFLKHSQCIADSSSEKQDSLESILFSSRLVDAYPKQPQYYYVLGMAYYRMELWDQAIKAFEHALQLDPKNPDIRLYLAYANLSYYKSKAALVRSDELFSKVLEENPQYQDAQKGLNRLSTINKLGKEEIEEPTSSAPSESELETLLFYRTLANSHPDDPFYLYSLGYLYYQLKDWKHAIHVFEEVLALQSKNQDAEVLLGYAFLFQYLSKENVEASQRLFEQVLEQVPAYTDASEGLKEAQAILLKAQKKSVHLSQKSKEAEKQASLLEKQKKDLEKHYVDALLKEAKEFSKKGCYRRAIDIYQKLVDQFPKNVDYLYLLGQEYVKIDDRCTAIDLFYQALEIKPDDSDVMIALGNQYLYFHHLSKSLAFFHAATKISPKDPAGWVGLARTEALLEQFERAEESFGIALSKQPDNPDVLEPYASFLFSRRRYRETENVYQYLSLLQDDSKTYRTRMFNTTAFTRPTFFATAGSTKEKEKDLFTHKWVASLLYNNAEIGFLFPVSDRLRFGLKGGWLDVKQSNLASKTILFDLKSFRATGSCEFFYNPYWTINTIASVEWIYNNDSYATLLTRRGTKFEPSLIFRYADTKDSVTFGEVTDSWIFKDFTRHHVIVFTRESALLVYQHDFDDHRLFGADCTWIWYQDPIYNQEQDLNAWVQAAVPYFEDLLTARYHCEYRQFREETSAYYSFVYQLTHWLKFNLTKEWLFGGRCELLYWHGWRTTRGRNPQQQITVAPNPNILPDVTVEDQIDSVTLTIGYKPTADWDFSLMGNYWHDSYDYTVWSSKCLIQWRF